MANHTEITEHARAVIVRQFGVPFEFVACDGADARKPDSRERTRGVAGATSAWLYEVAARCVREQRVVVVPLADALVALGIPIDLGPGQFHAAVGLFASRPLDVAETALAAGTLAGTALASGPIHSCDAELLQRLGDSARAAIAERIQSHARAAELRQLGAQVARNYEEITLLHQLTREARVSQVPATMQQQTLSLLADVLPARQIAFVNATDETVLAIGESVLASADCRQLIDRLRTRIERQPLVENHLTSQSWSRDLAGLERLAVVPVGEANRLVGWLMAINSVDGRELGSVEASLMSTVAAILATHHTNARLYKNVEELFMGAVRALSSAIDAKDPYTCGHSERVAWVARRLGRQLRLPEDESNRFYLGGLLHDVGKIGIRDSVLLKRGKLTEEEFKHIQQHPRIGFEILSGVRQLRLVLPAVRNHHESFDGTGYPDGLQGDAIPLIARVLAVADSFDAMSSNRPYRKGMPAEQIEQTFRERAGSQWDPQVVDAFLAAAREIRARMSKQRPSNGSPKSVERPTRDPASQQSALHKVTQYIAMNAT